MVHRDQIYELPFIQEVLFCYLKAFPIKIENMLSDGVSTQCYLEKGGISWSSWSEIFNFLSKLYSPHFFLLFILFTFFVGIHFCGKKRYFSQKKACSAAPVIIAN